jgi:hypothetical protein
VPKSTEMPHDPSLYHLFRRSLYSVEGSAQEATSGQNRSEAFCVAALGFVLNHDTVFKEFFVQRICGAEESTRASECRVVC